MFGSSGRPQKVLCLGFNQDNSCFMGGTDGGFFTYNTEPFAEGTRRTFENGGVGIVELLYRSNILALVGGGSCPQWPVNKVMLWDDTKRKCVGELSFHTPVKAVKIRKDIIVVVLERKVYVYNFVDLQMKHSFETIINPKGLCGLSLEPQRRVLAYPAEEKGTIRMELFDDTGIEKTVVIPAHESVLGALAVNRDGSLVCSASERGTLIRVFGTAKGELYHELRRGADRAVIYSLCFNANSTLLACTSDKCTVHIFTIGEDQQGVVQQQSGMEDVPSSSRSNDSSGNSHQSNNNENSGQSNGSYSRFFTPSTIFNMAGQAQNVFKDKFGEYLPKYFTTDTRRSVVRFPVPETFTICAFGSKPNTILVAGMDGSFNAYAFDVASGAHERTFFGSVHE